MCSEPIYLGWFCGYQVKVIKVENHYHRSTDIIFHPILMNLNICVQIQYTLGGFTFQAFVDIRSRSRYFSFDFDEMLKMSSEPIYIGQVHVSVFCRYQVKVTLFFIRS